MTCESQNPEEDQYLNLVREILSKGEERIDRTGTGTFSLFGTSMRFNLRHHYPLLTTKRVFYRGVVGELLWFLQGRTDASLLSEAGIHIWDGNASRAFLDSRGLFSNEENDLGPVYGFQWRHFGASYVDRYTDYQGQGIDQITTLIENIKQNPFDRRHILSAWNPVDLNKMALPPCHILAQFYVSQDGYLSCQHYQRSADVGLGVPFNLASYALLTIILAFLTGLKPGDYVAVFGDTHVYTNHKEALLEQCEREPRPFPTLKIRDECTAKTVDEFTVDDFILEGYNPHGKIAMKMSV